MAIDKIEITDRLRNHIIEIRKERGLSSYKLSEESGHSKFWLQNIESGKTKKINKKQRTSHRENQPIPRKSNKTEGKVDTIPQPHERSFL